jgi:hypothetical protein
VFRLTLELLAAGLFGIRLDQKNRPDPQRDPRRLPGLLKERRMSRRRSVGLTRRRTAPLDGQPDLLIHPVYGEGPALADSCCRREELSCMTDHQTHCSSGHLRGFSLGCGPETGLDASRASQRRPHAKKERNIGAPAGAVMESRPRTAGERVISAGAQPCQRPNEEPGHAEVSTARGFPVNVFLPASNRSNVLASRSPSRHGDIYPQFRLRRAETFVSSYIDNKIQLFNEIF